MQLPNVVKSLLDNDSILNWSILAFLDFKDDPTRVWLGFGDLVTTDGAIWRGIGDIVSISGGGQQEGFVAPSMTITLPATKSMISKTKDSEHLVKGRRIFLAIQFLDEASQIVDPYVPYYLGVMDNLTYNLSEKSSSVSLNVESPFVRRSIPRLAYFSDTDQKQKYPTDRFFENISSLPHKRLVF
jgi:hypothetical protein